ncbi:hypothetical protein SDC9_172852 [bioreactor metagenome]|uniref:Uncharacterized protein n=1 Tax=bioreactor metagenome TaxID=1076179 RepID=A0A645GP18_9ZZZZ
MGREDLRRYFNYYLCYGKLIVSTPCLKKYVEDVCDNKLKLTIYVYLAKLLKYYNVIIRRIEWCVHPQKKTRIVKNINDVVAATAKLEQLSDGIMHF